MKKYILTLTAIATLAGSLSANTNDKTFFITRGYKEADATRLWSDIKNWSIRELSSDGYNNETYQGIIPTEEYIVEVSTFSNKNGSSGTTTVYPGDKTINNGYFILDVNATVQGFHNDTGHNKFKHLIAENGEVLTIKRSNTSGTTDKEAIRLTGSNMMNFHCDVALESVADVNDANALLENVITNTGTYGTLNSANLIFSQKLTVNANTSLNRTADLHLVHGKSSSILINGKLNTAGNIIVKRNATLGDTFIQFGGNETNVIGGDFTMNGGRIHLAMTNNAQALGSSDKILTANNSAIISYAGNNQLGSNINIEVGTAKELTVYTELNAGTYSEAVLGADVTYNHSLMMKLDGYSDTVGYIVLGENTTKMIVDFGLNDNDQTFHFSSLMGVDGAMLIFENFGDGDKIYVDSNDASMLDFITITGFDGELSLNKVEGQSYYQIAIPEPSTYAMFVGLIALGIAMRRRK